MQNRSSERTAPKKPRPREPDFFEIRYPPGLAAHAFRYTQSDRPIVRLHRHQSVELGLCLSGSGVFIIEGKTFSYRAGDLCVISETEAHLASSAPDTSSDWIFLNFDPRALCAEQVAPEFLDTAPLSGPGFCNIFSGDKSPRLRECIRDFQQELSGQEPGFEAAVRALAQQMLVLLHRLPGRNVPPAFRDRLAAPAAKQETEEAFRRREHLRRIEPALELVASAYMKPLGLEDLARSCHLSPPHLRRLFREVCGCAPLEYLLRWRVRMAAALLQEGEACISDLALRSGFNSLSAFNRHFLRIAGCAPREYRRQHMHTI